MFRLFKCRAILLGGLMLIISTNVRANPVIVGYDDANPIYLDQRAAIRYCQNPNFVPQPAHLPSAREMAELAKSFGLKGIVNSCGSGKKCIYVKAINVDGSRDEFSYSYVRVSRAGRDFSSSGFWTSSTAVYPGGIYGQQSIIGDLNGDNGLAEFERGHDGGVLCVKGQ